MDKYNRKFRRIAQIMLEGNLVSIRMIYSGTCHGARAHNREIIALIPKMLFLVDKKANEANNLFLWNFQQ